MRRTRTFTSADKRRNTVVASGPGAGGGEGDSDASKALVRAPNMDNIVEYVFSSSSTSCSFLW